MKLASLVFIVAPAYASSPEDCAPCHRLETADIAKAGMTNALTRAEDSGVLRSHAKMTASVGGYKYEIAGSSYTVTDDKETLRLQLAWAFGQGATGQTYLFELDGRWYESTVSYYAKLGGLALTLGFDSGAFKPPRNLLEAAGRLTSKQEAERCFSCHSTGPIGGVQCERCHGDSAAHLVKPTAMKKLSALSAGAMSDFCGECHRTWADIAANGPRGITNVRFQPYRLASSKCYDASDKRISCTTCHDPHRTVATAPSVYDAKCAACHPSGATKRICKVAKKDCVTCHMPKVELPGAHRAFADHWIRVVKKNAPYPD